jgi:hypothetical protein
MVIFSSQVCQLPYMCSLGWTTLMFLPRDVLSIYLSRRVSYKGITSNKVGHNSVTHVTAAPIVGPGGRGTTNYPTFLRTVQPISPEPVDKLVREVRTSVNQTCFLVH